MGVRPSRLRGGACRCGWRPDAPRRTASLPDRLDTGLIQQRQRPQARAGQAEPVRLEDEVHPIAARSWRASPPQYLPLPQEQESVVLRG
jgi:hypothetical protein